MSMPTAARVILTVMPNVGGIVRSFRYEFSGDYLFGYLRNAAIVVLLVLT